jgi:hypothetical protein
MRCASRWLYEGGTSGSCRRMACRDGVIAGRLVVPTDLQLTRERILRRGGGGGGGGDGRVLCCGIVTCLILYGGRQGFPLNQSLFWAGAQSVQADRTVRRW